MQKSCNPTPRTGHLKGEQQISQICLSPFSHRHQNIDDLSKKNHCNELWRERIEKLNHIGKEEDADFIKAWLRSQNAKTIRERKKGAEAKDFDRIGTEFHRWVKDNESLLGLKEQKDFILFLEEDFAFYSKWYETIRKASHKLTEGMEHIFYNAQIGFTQQYQVLLASISKDDAEEVILKKLQAVATYLDIFLNRRMWNYRDNGYSTLSYNMFLLANMGVRPDLSVNDGFEAIEGNGPWGGEIVEHGIVMTSTDFVAAGHFRAGVVVSGRQVLRRPGELANRLGDSPAGPRRQ